MTHRLWGRKGRVFYLVEIILVRQMSFASSANWEDSNRARFYTSALLAAIARLKNHENTLGHMASILNVRINSIFSKMDQEITSQNLCRKRSSYTSSCFSSLAAGVRPCCHNYTGSFGFEKSKLPCTPK